MRDGGKRTAQGCSRGVPEAVSSGSVDRGLRGPLAPFATLKAGSAGEYSRTEKCTGYLRPTHENAGGKRGPSTEKGGLLLWGRDRGSGRRGIPGFSLLERPFYVRRRSYWPFVKVSGSPPHERTAHSRIERERIVKVRARGARCASSTLMKRSSAVHSNGDTECSRPMR